MNEEEFAAKACRVVVQGLAFYLAFIIILLMTLSFFAGYILGGV